MAWLILILSGMLEAAWALALSESKGFTRLMPSLVFLVAVTLSMVGLSYALRTLPVGTAYAVWVGIGATLTVVVGMATGAESISPAKIVFLTMIIGGVAGLKAVS
ncbi:DMT family transporter [Kribbia dieselivorans]|uniref:DMT family transporter n=1 Tax=Kribbia dieselivorans TaxID=331526 RepID=UPI000839A763|nr:multidrug efflux SMR transporter [Kribbia dieselivorans]